MTQHPVQFTLLACILLALFDLNGLAADRDVAPLPNTKDDPVEQEFTHLLETDDAAQTEIDRWIREDEAFAKAGAPSHPGALRARIRERLDQVQKAYETFLREHPNHARAHLAFGSFLNDIKEEDQAEKQWERARELDPSNPAAWNNLANHYGHFGPVQKAFAYYEKALSLNPNESVYYQNLATTVYLFRKDAMQYYHCDEKQVFDKALELYRKAVKLAPQDFPLATDYAETYYGIRPMRVDDALRAWNHALAIARDEIEREGVYVHLARIKLNAGRFQEAQRHLDAITNSMYSVLKSRLQRNLLAKEAAPSSPTNAPPFANPKLKDGTESKIAPAFGN